MTRQVDQETCEKLRADLRQFLELRPDVSLLSMVHHTPLSDCVGKSFMNGHLPGGREVVGELRRVLGLAQAGEIFPVGERRNGSVVTPTSARGVARRGTLYPTAVLRRVAEVLDHCFERAAIGVITGEFGCGKTAAVQAWRRERPKIESLVYEVTEFGSSSKTDFIREIARLLSLETPPGSQAGGCIFRDVCERLREAPLLLVIDQCETLRAKIFNVIRQIHDRCQDCGVGIVLLSAPVLLTRMTVSRITDLGAITSRVAIWAPLAGLDPEEMAAIVKAEGIDDVGDAAFDLWARLVGGSMRRLMRSIDMLQSNHSGRRVTEKTIIQMAGLLWGVQARVGAA